MSYSIKNSLILCRKSIVQLQETDRELQIQALYQLASIVDHCWHLVAEHIELIECLIENENFGEKRIATFVASKIYYHLDEISLSFQYALHAGEMFNIEDDSEYVRSLINQCIDEYIRIRKSFVGIYKISGKMENIIEKMLQTCLNEFQYRQGLGIALETQRIDLVEKTIRSAKLNSGILNHLFTLCETIVKNQGFRVNLFKLLLTLYQEVLRQTGNSDLRNVCKCLYFLRNATEVSKILLKLLDKSDLCLAYQTAFDLTEYENSDFLLKVQKLVKFSNTQFKKKEKEIQVNFSDSKERLLLILSGKFAEDVHLQILFSECRADLLILKNVKESISGQNGTLNMTVAAANAIMHCSTTIDQFLRDNLKWFGKFMNFDKFLSIAFIGMIHKGHLKEARTVLNAYLPPCSGSIANGGALYALGIIHSNFCPHDVKQYLYNHIRESESSDIYQHGAILGNGLVSIGTQNMKLFWELMRIMEKGLAIPSSAAGYSLGLIMAGTMNEIAICEILKYVTTDTHKKSEKVVRGGVLALALLCYGIEEKADYLIEKMKNHSDLHLRYGSCYAIALAYSATSNNKALRWLLDIAVSDVNNDVRRAASTAIGFVFLNKPNQVPELLRLLTKSYNPYVRYGAASAISIACAGTANLKAWNLLENLSRDSVGFVCQAAYIAMGALFMQRNTFECPEVKTVRDEFKSILKSNRKGSKVLIMGAILGLGLLDAGGRNMTIKLITGSGQKRSKAIIGMCLFWQFWNWYPMIPMISLCLKPTFAVGLNKDLNFPKISFFCNGKSSRFKYPEPLKKKFKMQKKILKTAELSTTYKNKERQIKKYALGRKEETISKNISKKNKDKFKTLKSNETEKDNRLEKNIKINRGREMRKEPGFFLVKNPCRVTAFQKNFVSLLKINQKYELVNKRPLTGFLLLRNKEPSKPEEFISLKIV